MKRPQVIFLAADGENLLPIDREPLPVRTSRQLRAHGFTDFMVLSGAGIGALSRGLAKIAGAVLIIDAGVVLDDPAVAEIAHVTAAGDSVWFTEDRFGPADSGGILRADSTGAVRDLRQVDGFDKRFDRHRKVLGVLAIGAKQRPLYLRLLREAAAESPAQSYLVPWGEHLAALPCSAYHLEHRRVARCAGLQPQELAEALR